MQQTPLTSDLTLPPSKGSINPKRFCCPAATRSSGTCPEEKKSLVPMFILNATDSFNFRSDASPFERVHKSEAVLLSGSDEIERNLPRRKKIVGADVHLECNRLL